jgi:hypothetical protein
MLRKKEASMDYIVIENHRTEFPNPIILQKGEKVVLGKETDIDDEAGANWVYCKKLDDSNEGWVPKQIIDNATIIEEYHAKELNIDKGTVVEGIKELNTWLWCRNKNTDEVGWIPMRKLLKK